MGRHNESPDADVSLLSDVTVRSGPIPLTRREIRQQQEALASTLSVEILEAEAQLAEEMKRQSQELRRSRERHTPVRAGAEVVPPLETWVDSSAVVPAAATVEATVEAPAQVLLEMLVTAPIVEQAHNEAAPEVASLQIVAPQSPSPRRASARRVATPRAIAPRRAPPRGLSVAVSTPRRNRHITARLLSVTAMVFVAAIAVATSVPANALLSSADIQALSVTQAQSVVSMVQNGQSVDGTGASVAAGRDGVSVSGGAPVKAYTDVTSQKVALIVPNSTGPILWPFPKPVPLTDGFGARQGMWTAGGYTGNFHTGQDFDPGAGTPIQAVADGIVSEVSSTLCGTAVVIDHNVNGEKFQSEYCHMVYGSTTVTAGQSITAGTVIGNVGETGMATGPHLHLEIHINGNAIDPLPFLRSRSHEW